MKSEITKEQLLRAGLRLLDSTGRSSLKISTICSSLKLTKGSFYHWFDSKQQFDLSLLSYWRQLYTSGFIDDANEGENARQKLDRLINNCIDSAKDNSRLEIEINMWAKQDAQIGQFVEQVYEQRFAYLLALMQDIYPDQDEAKRHAHIVYSLIIGVDLFYKTLSKPQMAAVFRQYLL